MAITFLDGLDFVNAKRIGIWGTNFSGGHAIVLGATDRRLRAVVTQVPTISGWESGLQRVPPNAVADLERAYDDVLRAQFQGAQPKTIKIADIATVVPSVLATVDGNIANVRGFGGKLIKNSEFRTASEPDVAYQSKSESLDESPVCILIRITPKCFRSHLRLR